MGKEEEERVQEGEGEEKEEDEEDEEDGFVSRHARAVRAKKPDKLYSDAVSEKLKSLEEGAELEDYEWKQVMAPQSVGFRIQKMQDAFSNLKGHVMEANRNPRGKLYNQVRRMIALTSAVKEMQSASSDIQKAFRGFQARKNVKLDLGKRRGSQMNYIPALQPTLAELIENKFNPREQEMIHRLLAELALEKQEKEKQASEGSVAKKEAADDGKKPAGTT
ncbi:hypothetical protein GUITHDRAFT_146788 [Guillardia theta CCMP2712]|uniref:Uncharacterized protein n=1 Tax=Guillardia theta (strain CCMP2712) TaxID=905079 RepID=L1IGS4_GUITC|nr:hypothetical protein GUITHDRAFT_146788 [Guillardia theta CCMP2712]EKX35035.1 hypothetical protein GUITHDRAFT_146788 [Guillardia theta CCMP2712]|eukprot:XP_005822015.1 hypothetical protein GUITHDRAFT_146788 [Guillardia theta CCMP2712]